MIGLVHLVWAPLGPQPLRRFLASYAAHPAGAAHELTVLLNGATVPGALTREELLGELQQTPHRLIELEQPMLDLAAYRSAAERLDHELLCFVNSYAEALADGWLGALGAALERPDIGLAGATGSWESQAEWRRGRIRHRPQQILLLGRSRHDYPRFPNPHLRTSTFMIERSRLLELNLPPVADKRDAYLIESGPRSLTRRLEERRLRSVVVGRDGRVYDPAEWPSSGTFRSGDQENLLVADNQTREYQSASPGRRRQLIRDSWGRAETATLDRSRDGDSPFD